MSLRFSASKKSTTFSQHQTESSHVVGDSDGDFVGLSLGLSLGLFVGLSVGDSVGLAVGSVVGDRVVGLAVGDLDGEGVGWSVLVRRPGRDGSSQGPGQCVP